MKPSDELLLAAYEDQGSVHKVATLFDMSGASVHRRLKRLGATKPINVFTDSERERLLREYNLFASTGTVAKLAASMGRTRHFLCRQAKDLGLTDRARSHPWAAVWKYLSDEAAEAIWSDFKASSLGLGQYCRKRRFDDLGFSRAMRDRFADEYEHVIEAKMPRGTRYVHGRRFEYRARDDLKRHGYFVMRSPASKSPLDLIAVREGHCVMVQCKRSGALPPSEWNAMYDLAVSCGAVPIMAMEALGNRGCSYFRMLDRKDGSRRRQPMAEWKP